MKKKNLKSLKLNKKSISNFKSEEISGGTGKSVNQTCTGMAGCTFDSLECLTAMNFSCMPCSGQQ
ncbi:hypothetical protein [uncultured Lacinutrix sp.]|uniref:hypothetical protein n=1 Tax=uncultured Lacinutrix sp. TaxID=574032 RepID=UPI0026048CCA|nr:hypothetical protein [uncultured Lacinutrix sp.]